MMKKRTRTKQMAAMVASVCLVAGACGGDDDTTPVSDPSQEMSDDMTADMTADMSEEMSDDMSDDMSEEMSDDMSDDMSDEMSDDMSDDMSEDATGPTGPLCEAVPADGDGSFEGMADDPAATAASNNPALSTLVAAVTAAGLGDTLNGDGPFTIFAPANQAFDPIPEADLNALLGDTDALTNLLTFHVVSGERLSSGDLLGMDSVTTVQGGDLTLEEVDGTLRVNGQATVGCADVQTANATVHIIDAVLMPTADGAGEDDG